jgi:hypothetical protein
MEQMIGFYMISFLTTAGLFYTLGYSTGKRDGHKLGRSVGIRIGERRATERVR